MKQWIMWATIATLLAFGNACSMMTSFTRDTDGVKGFSYRTVPPMDDPPQRLIGNYSTMATHDAVAWLWLRPGVSLQQIRAAALDSLENYTPVDFPWAEHQLRNALEELFPPARHAPGDIAVKAAIVELLPRAPLFKRLFPGFDDQPYIEVELVFFEPAGGRSTAALIHYAKDKDFSVALNRLINELRTLFNPQSPDPPPQ